MKDLQVRVLIMRFEEVKSIDTVHSLLYLEDQDLRSLGDDQSLDGKSTVDLHVIQTLHGCLPSRQTGSSVTYVGLRPEYVIRMVRILISEWIR